MVCCVQPFIAEMGADGVRSLKRGLNYAMNNLGLLVFVPAAAIAAVSEESSTAADG